MSNDQAYFAKLAAESKAAGPGIEKCPPPLYNPGIFVPSERIAPPDVKQTFEQQTADYISGISALRKKYDRFLHSRVPEPKFKRRRMYINAFDFRFESDRDKTHFEDVLTGKGEWERITLPHYHGPVGRWTSFYRSEFRYIAEKGKRTWLNMLGTDYISELYINGRFVGGHEGMFSPYRLDVTQYLRRGKNTLVAVIKNDLTTTGTNGDSIDGDKIYAATGIGWDDPQVGWHHCPPGGGIYNKVYLEQTNDYFIDSVFMRPDIDNASVEAWAQVFNCTDKNYTMPDSDKGLTLGIKIFAYNFDADSSAEKRFKNLAWTGPGINYYRHKLKMRSFSLWTPDEPCLYCARVSLYSISGKLLDQIDQTFGMRKFHMDSESKPDKGEIYLNNKPVRLRGANDMGHMQVAVCNEDWEQVITDILIAKYANMNYYRLTQRPVQDEIYHYCDMLGMMNQTDLPLFGTMRRNQFAEAVRQCGEMERLVRSHPSCIMVTYINEAFCIEKQNKCHRHLGRPELESFFECCDRVIKLENPDRVIKRVEGDYDPPTNEGLSDFHCYNMWYTNHALPIGRLYSGWLPAIRTGWKTGCGEYGTEGLDSLNIMKTRYPAEWLPDNDGTWLPDRIVNSQTNSMHGDWYEEQEGIENWISESQRHQALATRMMTDAFRRRSDKLVSTAIHLLIDAWPAGWMKVLVGVDRKPKPSYFEFRQSLTPLRLNLRCDRFSAYSGETVTMENYLLNDTSEAYDRLTTVITVRDTKKTYGSYELTDSIGAASSKLSGKLSVKLPDFTEKSDIFYDAELLLDGKTIYSEHFTQTVYPKPNFSDISAGFIGKRAEQAILALGINISSDTNSKVVFVSDPNADLERLESAASHGCKVVLLPTDNEPIGYKTGSKRIGYEYIFSVYDAVDGALPFDHEDGVTFVARNDQDAVTKEFAPRDFMFLYNSDKDFIDTTAVNRMIFDGINAVPLLWSYAKPTFFDKTAGHKRRLPVAARLSENMYALSLSIDGRLGFNPVLDKFIYNIIGG